jgi:hypothetical protein
MLGDPPTCPVDSCGETLRGGRVAQHVIERHDGSLMSDPA